MVELLEGKAAIVTGAAQGIGFAIADRSGGKAIGMRADVTSKTDVEAVVQRAIEEFGGIDILVNNAGILIHAPMLEMKEEDWDRIFRVNVKGFFLFAPDHSGDRARAD